MRQSGCIRFLLREPVTGNLLELGGSAWTARQTLAQFRRLPVVAEGCSRFVAERLAGDAATTLDRKLTNAEAIETCLGESIETLIARGRQSCARRAVPWPHIAAHRLYQIQYGRRAAQELLR